MLDIHSRIHPIKSQTEHKQSDSIPPLAYQLLKEANILCFDDFQISDIADAVIIK